MNRPLPSRTYAAHSKGCNFCFVIPEWNMVVVRMGTVPISTGNIAKSKKLRPQTIPTQILCALVDVTRAGKDA